MAEEKAKAPGEADRTGAEENGAAEGEEETLDARDVLFAICYEAHQKGEKYRLTYDALEETLSAAGLLDIWDEALEKLEEEDDEDDEDDEDSDAEGDVDDDED